MNPVLVRPRAMFDERFRERRYPMEISNQSWKNGRFWIFQPRFGRDEYVWNQNIVYLKGEFTALVLVPLMQSNVCCRSKETFFLLDDITGPSAATIR